MAFVIAAPEAIAAAAQDLAGLGAALSQANSSSAVAACFRFARAGISGPERPSGVLPRPIRESVDHGRG